MATEPDRWSRWLLERRDANDAQQRQATLEHLAPIRDRVLSGAEPLEGTTVLDIGTGDGLIGLAALERVGPQGTVIFSDVSDALLAQSRRAVSARGLSARARFVSTRAQDLAEIPDATIDVVTTRSVLIYVAEKAQAFAAMRRVLRGDGKISLFEPINRLMFPEPRDRFWGYDVAAVTDLADKVKATFDALEAPATATMTDFDDRDLVRLAEAAGFKPIHLECHIDIEPGSLMRASSLAGLLNRAPNPLAPTVGDAVEAALTKTEQNRFLAHLERVIAEDQPVRRSAVAYLTARKPG